MPSKKTSSKKNLSSTRHPTSQFKKPELHEKELPLFYLLFANVVAMVGYYFILLFPTLFIVSVYNTYILLPYYSRSDSLATFTLLWLTLSLFFGHISYNILTIDFAAIPGLKIKRKSAGFLYKLLADIQQNYPRVKIKNIIITSNYELKLVKIPRIGIPIFGHTALMVGLPLMLTLSPNQFNCLCTREIIRFANSRPFTASWLNQLRDTWSRYLSVLKPRSCIGHQLLFWFFRVYSLLYNSVSRPVRLRDELNADRNALDLINSDELLGAFQASLRANIYLRKDFWPRIQNANGGAERLHPFSVLSRATKTVLLQVNSNDWLQKHDIGEQCTREQWPTLAQRMDNLGLSIVTLPPDLTQTAAEYYFQNYYAKIILLSDANWRELQRAGSTGRPTGVTNRLSTSR